MFMLPGLNEVMRLNGRAPPDHGPRAAGQRWCANGKQGGGGAPPPRPKALVIDITASLLPLPQA